MKYLLEKIVEKREIVAADIVMRIKSIISGSFIPKSRRPFITDLNTYEGWSMR